MSSGPIPPQTARSMPQPFRRPFRSPIRRLARALPPLLAVLASSGCAVMGALSGGPQRDVFELRAPTPAMHCARTRIAELVVEAPKASGPIDSNRILVRPNPLQIQYLPDAEWGDSVPVMVQTLMVRKLAAYPVFSHVGRAPLGNAGDYALLSEVGDFSAVVEGRGAVITLRLAAQIVDEMSARVVARRDFTAQVPVAGTATPELIEGFDLAGRQLFDQVGSWASGALRGDCRPAG